MSDPVNHPAHYTTSKVECIDAIQSALTPEEFRGYVKGNAIKYLWRERLKGGDEDLKKARWYVEREIETREKEGKNAEEIDYGKFRGIAQAITDDLIHGRSGLGYGMLGLHDKCGDSGAPNKQPDDRCGTASQRLEGVCGAGGAANLQPSGYVDRLEGGSRAEFAVSTHRGDYRER